MLVVALKRAGFAGSRSRTALWEIPTEVSLYWIMVKGQKLCNPEQEVVHFFSICLVLSLTTTRLHFLYMANKDGRPPAIIITKIIAFTIILTSERK
jgi:hypothetical protein